MTDVAATSGEACDWERGNFRCTRPVGHPDDNPSLGGHIMRRDVAIRWWGTKTSHVWKAPDPPAGSMVVSTLFEEA